MIVQKMWFFFFDVETRNYRNFYTAKRNNEWALVNLQGQDRFVRHREQNDENKAQSRSSTSIPNEKLWQGAPSYNVITLNVRNKKKKNIQVARLRKKAAFVRNRINDVMYF